MTPLCQRWIAIQVNISCTLCIISIVIILLMMFHGQLFLSSLDIPLVPTHPYSSFRRTIYIGYCDALCRLCTLVSTSRLSLWRNLLPTALLSIPCMPERYILSVPRRIEVFRFASQYTDCYTVMGHRLSKLSF